MTLTQDLVLLKVVIAIAKILLKNKYMPTKPTTNNLECKHEPTGKWMIDNQKSMAECKKCGWYKTTLLENKI